MAERGKPTKLTPTLQEKVCNMLRMGNYVETAVAHAGIRKNAHYDWIKRGKAEINARASHVDTMAKERERDAERKRKLPRKEQDKRTVRNKARSNKSGREQKFVDYYDAIEKALADGEIAALSIVATAAQGRAVLSTSTTTDAATGAVTVTKKHAKPDVKAAQFLLERRHPDRWGRSVKQVEMSGPGQGPIESKTWTELVAEAWDENNNPDDDFGGA